MMNETIEPALAMPVAEDAPEFFRGRGMEPEAEDGMNVPARNAGGQVYGWNERAAEPKGGLLSASGLFEGVVRDANGKRLGEIEDFILDFAEGEIEYVVFSFGGFFGLGNKLCAVAPNLLELDEEHKCFRLSYDKARVGNAPEFDKYEWQHLPWTAHRSRIYILRGKKRPKEAKKAHPDQSRPQTLRPSPRRL